MVAVDSIASGVNNRISGVMLGLAAGDAMGAGYEFGPPPVRIEDMKGGGPFDWPPGSWTDDTSMALMVAWGLVESDKPFDLIADLFSEWETEAVDVGNQTRLVIASARKRANGDTPTAQDFWDEARILSEASDRTAGNGSLMRTAPVGLIDTRETGRDMVVRIAARVSDLTHWDADAREACAIWSYLINYIVYWTPPRGQGRFSLQHAMTEAIRFTTFTLSSSPAHSSAAYTKWHSRVDKAMSLRPKDAKNNGWVVEAFMAAYSAVVNTDTFEDAIGYAVSGGGDADTVAAIAGSLAGAIYGAQEIPERWRTKVRGWPAGASAVDLIDAAMNVKNRTLAVSLHTSEES